MTDIERELVEYQETKLVVPNNEMRKRLWELCEQFIDTNEITCGETIYQMDHISLKALGFIEEICEIVGYTKYDD